MIRINESLGIIEINYNTRDQDCMIEAIDGENQCGVSNYIPTVVSTTMIPSSNNNSNDIELFGMTTNSAVLYSKILHPNIQKVINVPIGEYKAIDEEAKMDNWKHRSEGMKCRACMWFMEKQGNVGRCKKHAPTLNGFPVVMGDDWCGDHKLDETTKEE